ncbi:M13-type metalloendopeptidase [Pseudobutyrivibrio sp.]|uniref:M13-type metalloendopeptidase n=1 Tax=Pseudobutyrivibrio sp. TaxID=2014367 RepID=UPI001DABFE37|nr:M13 family metallopeptidase [Pseudobutyrivibrio sp.]MBE5911338.1 M13 family metallopeptidase [Pseudobutyrivibrio sp.]
MKIRDLNHMLNGGKRLTSLLLIAMLSLSACGKKETKQEEKTTETTEEQAAEEQADASSYTDGNPWMDSDLKENITEGLETSPTDDFHLYCNYDWMLSAEIPEGYTSYNTFTEVYQDITANSLAVLQDDNIDSHDAKLCQTLYNQCLDWDARNEQGMAPAEKVIDDLEAIANIDDLNGYLLSEDSDIFVSPFISLYNDAGLSDSSSYVLFIDGIGFTLGGAEEYTDRTAQGDAVYDAYKELTVNLLGRIGYSEADAEKMFDNSISFETKLAEVSYTSGDEMSSDYVQMINNPYTMDDFCDEFTNYPAKDLIELYGYEDAKELLVANPDYFQRLDEVYVNDNIEEIKDYLIVDYITSVAPYLDKDAYDAIETAHNAIYGSTGSTPDDEVALSYVSTYLTEPLDRAYLEKYDSTQKKEDITEICNSIIETYREMLEQEDWLSDETKEKAIEKLDSITVNAVYPDKWESDFNDLELSEDSFLESIELINTYLGDLDVAKTNGKVDPEIWGFDILETNAYYNPSGNSINIILGILDGPFYNEDMTTEEMYGGIGCIIGHELSHAFDTNGAQFDKDGNLNDWWTEEDYQAFTDRAQKLDDYYDGITVWGDVNVVGEYVETEAIADMTGMNAILNMAKDVEDFDYELFFESFARLWVESTYQESENYYLTQDVHPLSYLRTNVTVQQFDEFYDTFDVKEGDNMYLAPEDRILVW